MRIWILLIALVILPLAYAKDCMVIDPLTEQELPCQIITSFPYENACNTYIIKIYNSTPSLIGQHTMDSYTGTDICNASFNFTDIGTYTFNISSGESGRIVVEHGEDNMASFAIMAFMMALTGAVFWIGLRYDFYPENAIANMIIRRSLFIGGLFLIILDLAMLLTISTTFGVGVNNELFRFLWFAHKLAWLSTVGLLLSTLFRAVNMNKAVKERRRMGYDE